MEDTTANTNVATTTDGHENDFQNTSRVGRRNALPDILNEDGTTTTATDLPEKLSALTTNDPNESTPGTTANATNSPSKS